MGYMFNKGHYTTAVCELHRNPHTIKCYTVELAHRFKESTDSKANILP